MGSVVTMLTALKCCNLSPCVHQDALCSSLSEGPFPIRSSCALASTKSRFVGKTGTDLDLVAHCSCSQGKDFSTAIIYHTVSQNGQASHESYIPEVRYLTQNLERSILWVRPYLTGSHITNVQRVTAAGACRNLSEVPLLVQLNISADPGQRLLLVKFLHGVLLAAERDARAA